MFWSSIACRSLWASPLSCWSFGDFKRTDYFHVASMLGDRISRRNGEIRSAHAVRETLRVAQPTEEAPAAMGAMRHLDEAADLVIRLRTEPRL